MREKITALLIAPLGVFPGCFYEVAVQLVELEKAKKVIRQMDAESDRRHKIAGLFCKAFERAVLLTPSEENVRIWTECTRMRPDEIEDSAKEADELAEVFSTIAAILRALNCLGRVS